MGADRPVPPRPDQRPLRLPLSSWIKLVVAVGLALAAIALFPRSGGDAPPLASLALIGAVIAGVTTLALYAIVRRDLRLPSRVAISLAFAFVLIAVVKFVLAPLGLYEVNAVKPLQDVLGSVADPLGAAITAAVVFGFYALGYSIIFRIGHRRAGDRSPSRVRFRRRTLVVGLVGLGLVVVSGLGVIVLAVLAAPGQYLEFVFSSGSGILVVVALATAATLIGYAFRNLDQRSQVIDVGTIVALFWLGLGFLALFHVLWIVYVLVLGSIWPLKTVVPK